MGAELVPFTGVQGPFQQGSENGGFHFLPVCSGSLQENADAFPVQRQHFRIFKNVAVEPL